MQKDSLTVLVTGATGFLGSRLAKRLVAEGYAVRALVRRSASAGPLRDLGVEVALGDLREPSAVSAAASGAHVVVHAGAGTSGTAADSEAATIGGTRNVLEACAQHKVEKLLHISSLGVYELAGCIDREVLTEQSVLERLPMLRGHYSAAKLHAERLVASAMGTASYRTTVLRLGTLYEPGTYLYSPMMGLSLGRRLYLVFGDGRTVLPLLHVDNAVEAIVECMRSGAADQQIFNVVDLGPVTKRMYMDRVVSRWHPRGVTIYCPISILMGLTWIQQKLASLVSQRPVLTVYGLAASQRNVRYSTSKIESMVGWRPKPGLQTLDGSRTGSD